MLGRQMKSSGSVRLFHSRSRALCASTANSIWWAKTASNTFDLDARFDRRILCIDYKWAAKWSPPPHTESTKSITILFTQIALNAAKITSWHSIYKCPRDLASRLRIDSNPSPSISASMSNRKRSCLFDCCNISFKNAATSGLFRLG